MREEKQVAGRELFECNRCGWKWFSKVQCPCACPKCHSPYYDRERKIYRTEKPVEEVISENTIEPQANKTIIKVQQNGFRI